MVYVYDILLNFCDNNLLYDFYEWNSEDIVENIRRIKLALVSKDLYDSILKNDVIVEKDFLLKIFKTCEYYDKKKIKILDYCCLFSDGERVLAVEFDKNGKSIYKSKLLLDEEEEIAVLASNLDLIIINIKVNSKVLSERFFTRNELKIRRFLLSEIRNAYSSKNYDKLKYLYQECFDDNDNSYKSMKDKLVSSIDLLVNDKHKELYNLLRLAIKK